MKNKLMLDFFREIRKNFGRFISIFFIVMLGTAFFAGLRSAGSDMKLSADKYYDDTKLMDIRVIGTLGLSESSLETIKKAKNVELVKGAKTKEVIWNTDEAGLVVKLISLTDDINRPYLVKGRLPEKPDECLLDTKACLLGNHKIGDKISVTSDDDSSLSDDLTNTEFTVTGIADLPYYTEIGRGSGSIGHGSIDSFLVILPEVFKFKVYTEAYLKVKNADSLMTYSDSYKDFIAPVTAEIESMEEEISAERLNSVKSEAEEDIRKGEKEISDAEKKLADAKKEINDGKNKLKKAEKKVLKKEKELNKAVSKFNDGKAKLDKAKKEINDGKAKLASSEKLLNKNKKELDEAKNEYNKGLKKYNKGLKKYSAGLTEYLVGKKTYDEGLAKYNTGLDEYNKNLTAYEEGIKKYEAAASRYEAAKQAGYSSPETEARLSAEKASLDAAKTELDKVNTELIRAKTEIDTSKIKLDGVKSELDSAREELDSSKEKLDKAEIKIKGGESELGKALETLEEKRKELKHAEKIMAEKETELADAKKKLDDGASALSEAKDTLNEKRSELDEAEKEYKEKLPEATSDINEAKEKIADAKKELKNLSMPDFYVLDRDKIESYVSFEQNSDRMDNLGNVFPVIFFLVAALVSLTTMTRMVDEQRLNMGILKALGYSDVTISGRYIFYCMSATISGSLIGIAIGERFLPLLIIKSYGTLFISMPYCLTPVNYEQGIFALGAATLSTVTATVASSIKQLLESPAVLMRPEPPKHGKRVLLERLSFIWKRLNFTGKATVRNLARYKKRLFMTVIGIGGCMGLLLVGFGLRDSIQEIAKKQYINIFTYDAAVSIKSKSSNAEKDELKSSVLKYDGIKNSENVYLLSADLTHGNAMRNAILFVPKNMENIKNFVTLKDRITGEDYGYPEGDGAFISEKTAAMLSLKIGDTVDIKREGEKTVSVRIEKIVENYVFHYLFLSPKIYKNLYGSEPEYNTLYLKYGDGQISEDSLGKFLLSAPACAGVKFTTELQENIDSMLKVLNLVIYVLIISAGLLAFVVLYNLNNINILERKRELATLKVLGFFDGEVSSYVYRENVLLTVFGMIFGVIFGTILHLFTIKTVEVDLMMFGRKISLESYLLSILLTIAFSLVVNAVMYVNLKKIDMIEALKSIE